MLSACTPLKVHINPQPNITELNYGEGKMISLRVIDLRLDKSFGQTAPARPPLTSDQNIPGLLEQEISKGLRKKGFEISKGEDTSGTQLTIELKRLKLISSFRHAEFNFKCICKNPVKSFEKNFRAQGSRDQELLMNISDSVTKTMSDELLNFVSSNGLAKMLQDVEVLQCLKQS